MPELAGSAGEPLRVRVAAGCRDQVPARALDDEGAGEELRRPPTARRAGTPRSGSTRRAAARRPSTTSPSATTWSPAPTTTRSPSTTSPTATALSIPSRTTVACGATSAARRSSLRFARTSCQIPIAEFVTMIPRKSASRQSAKARVSPPRATRIALKGVRTFARTMLAVERTWVSTASALASRRLASASVSPTGVEAPVAAVAVSVPSRSSGRARRSPAAARCP